MSTGVQFTIVCIVRGAEAIFAAACGTLIGEGKAPQGTINGSPMDQLDCSSSLAKPTIITRPVIPLYTPDERQ